MPAMVRTKVILLAMRRIGDGEGSSGRSVGRRGTRQARKRRGGWEGTRRKETCTGAPEHHAFAWCLDLAAQLAQQFVSAHSLLGASELPNTSAKLKVRCTGRHRSVFAEIIHAKHSDEFEVDRPHLHARASGMGRMKHKVLIEFQSSIAVCSITRF